MKNTYIKQLRIQKERDEISFDAMLQTLKEIQSIYLNKKEVSNLTVFEIGILEKVQQALKK